MSCKFQSEKLPDFKKITNHKCTPKLFAGGSFAYLRVELGEFVAFIAAGNILLEYVIGGAAVARAWTSYFATLCNHKPEDFRITAHSLASGYNKLDPIAVGVVIIICIIAVASTKGMGFKQVYIDL